MEIIKSKDNSQYKKFKSLKIKKYRQQYQLFLIEGEHLIQEAIKANLIEKVLIKENYPDIFAMPCMYFSESLMDGLSSNVSGANYIGICKLNNDKVFELNRVIVLENVQDPGNVGTIIRTAYSFGFDTVLLSEGCGDVYNQKVIQASQGSMFHINTLEMPINDIIEIIKQKKLYTIATALTDNSVSLPDSQNHENIALLFGNEGQGLSPVALRCADEVVKIPMSNFESLNVACAAAICLYHYRA